MAREPKPNGAVALSAGAGTASKQIVKQSKRTRKQPYKRTEKLTSEFLVRLACGESMIEICADPKMPARQTIMQWAKDDPEFEKLMDDAYKWKGRYLGEAILSVAEGGQMSTGDIRRDELKVKALMWLAGKYNRKLFGDAVQHEITDTRPVINLPPHFADLWATQEGQIIGPENPQEALSDTKALQTPDEQ